MAGIALRIITIERPDFKKSNWIMKTQPLHIFESEVRERAQTI